jgi:hypothetical protein
MPTSFGHGDNKDSASDVVGRSTGACKNATMPIRADNQSLPSLNEDEIAELSMEKPVSSRPLMTRSHSATAVVTTDANEELRDEMLLNEQNEQRMPPSNFNPMYAVAIIEEAREEIETLVMFDTYQRFLLAQRPNTENKS